MVLVFTKTPSLVGQRCCVVEKAEHQQTMDHLNNFLKAKNMPLDFRIELRSFFTQRNILQVSAREQALVGAMSPALRGKAVHRRSAWLFNVCYLKDANILLITKIESQLSGQIYPPLEQVEWEDSLTTVSQGLAARRGKIYRKGCYWGEDFILASPNLKNRRPVNTLTYVELLSLPRDRFFALLQDFPEQYYVVRTRETARRSNISTSTGLSPRTFARSTGGARASEREPRRTRDRACVTFCRPGTRGASCSTAASATSRRSRGAATTRASRSSGCRATRCRT